MEDENLLAQIVAHCDDIMRPGYISFPVIEIKDHRVSPVNGGDYAADGAAFYVDGPNKTGNIGAHISDEGPVEGVGVECTGCLLK